MLADGQRTKWLRNIAENYNRLSRMHQRCRQTTDDRQTTDGRTTTYRERGREFTFAKNDTFSGENYHFSLLLRWYPELRPRVRL